MTKFSSTATLFLVNILSSSSFVITNIVDGRNSAGSRLKASNVNEIFASSDLDDDIEDYSHFSDEDNLKGYFHRVDGNPEDDPLSIYAPEEEVVEEVEDNYEELGFSESEIDFMRTYEAKEREGKKSVAVDVYRYFLLYQELVARNARKKPQVWNLDAFTKRKSWRPKQVKVPSLDEDGEEVEDEEEEEDEEPSVFVEDDDVENYIRDVQAGNRTMFKREEGLQNDDILDQSNPDVNLSVEVQNIKKDLAIPETFLDKWYTEEEVERFRSEPEDEDVTMIRYEPKPFENNRFTKQEDKTDFTKMDPYRARKTAVELARSTNNEWLPEGYSEEKKVNSLEEMTKRGLLVGTIRPGECDPDIVNRIQPAVNVFNGCAELLSISDGVFRFHYHGMIRHKHGMKSYMEKLLKDCEVHVTGVVFETGRERDSRDSTIVEK